MSQQSIEDRTFLFTDVEDSSVLWERHPVAMRAALSRHDAILRDAAGRHGGVVFKTIGDAFCVAFTAPSEALKAALAAQHALHTADWGEVGAVRVRMALHCGQSEARDGDFFGPPLNQTARLRDAGHGGQTLTTAAVVDCLDAAALPPGVHFDDRGVHPFKGVGSLHVFQVSADDLPANFPPLQTAADAYHHNLPADTTAFVGRSAERRALQNLLNRRDVRLITMTGMGGTGKTRVALGVAEQMLWRYPDGVWFLDVSELAGASDLFPALLHACSLREDSVQTPRQQLANHFRTARALLVLDGFERHEEAADELAALLKGTEHLQALVTSRALLHLSMEHEYSLPPLSLAESMEMFGLRAAQAQTDFVMSEAVRAEVESICARLEGIPLAVELAAAQTRNLTLPEIRDALSERLEVLSTRARDLHPRHRSLRSTIDWSYELLEPQEQQLFCALSCFVGGFTVNAVHLVCAVVCGLVREGARPMAAARTVTEALESLRDRSLIRAERDDTGDGGRFTLLESLREYGREVLSEENPELGETLAARHTDFFLQLVEKQEPLLSGGKQGTAVALLAREAANVRAAGERTLQGNAESLTQAARFGVALRRFWSLRGWLYEGQEFFDRVLARNAALEEPELRARLLVDAGLLNWSGPRAKRAAQLFEQCVALCQSTPFPGSDGVEGKAWNGLGMVAYAQGDLNSADTYYERSLELRRAAGDVPGQAGLLTNMGIQAAERGNYERATTLFQEALQLREQQGDAEMVANLWNCLGGVAEGEGNLDQARDAYAKAEHGFQQLGAVVQGAMALYNRGSVAATSKEWAEARRCFDSALQVLRAEREPRGVPECLLGLGRVALAEGGIAQARRLSGEGLEAYRRAGDQKGLPVALEQLAEVAVQDDEAVYARRFLGAANQLREATGTKRRWHQEQQNALLVARLGTLPLLAPNEVEAVLEEATGYSGLSPVAVK